MFHWFFICFSAFYMRIIIIHEARTDNRKRIKYVQKPATKMYTIHISNIFAFLVSHCHCVSVPIYVQILYLDFMYSLCFCFLLAHSIFQHCCESCSIIYLTFKWISIAYDDLLLFGYVLCRFIYIYIYVSLSTIYWLYEAFSLFKYTARLPPTQSNFSKTADFCTWKM